MIPLTVTSYEQLLQDYALTLPDRLNIATVICDRHAATAPDSIAVIVDSDKGVQHYSYADLKRLSDNLAHGFAGLRVRAGDRVVVSLGQDVEALLAHLAIFRIGAVSVPVAGLYAGDAMAFRVADSDAVLVVTDRAGADKIAGLGTPRVKGVVVTHGKAQGGEVDFDGLLQADRGTYPVADTSPTDPAVIFYTSGSTGQPKGALHGHRLVLGHLRCFQLGFEMAPQPEDVFWTASDWSWLGSIGDLIFPALYFGKTLVCTPGRFTSERAYRILQEHRVTCPFLATAVLRKLSKEPVPAKASFVIRGIMTGGEAMPPEVFKWSRETFKAPVNEEFGLTEANQVAVGCESLYTSPAGTVGRIAPGCEVVIMDDQGEEVPVGTRGEIAIWFDSPSNMLGYLNRPEQTASKLLNGWFRTGDEGKLDADNFLYYYGRLDDLILVNGLRVGPEEVEAELLLHPAVREVAVVGLPDPASGEAVVAAIILQDGVAPDDHLTSELQLLVKRNLAAHSYPKRMVFVETIPVTSTGKIQRREVRKALLAAETAGA